MSSSPPPRATPLAPDDLAAGLAEVYQALGPLYRKVSRAVERLQPMMGMSVGVRSVLELLERSGPMTVPGIARAQQLSRQFVQRMVNDAIAEGWVEPRPNPAHQRSPLIALTGPGAAAIAAVTRRELDLMSRVPGELTRADLHATLKVLAAMTAGLDLVAEEGDAEQAP